MGFDNVEIAWQQENSFLHDQKHQEYMRAALEMVCQG